MVLCIVPSCSKRSGRDKVSFFRIPKVVHSRGFKKEQISRKRRAGFLAAIKREGLTDKILENDRVCLQFYHLAFGNNRTAYSLPILPPLLLPVIDE